MILVYSGYLQPILDIANYAFASPSLIFSTVKLVADYVTTSIVNMTLSIGSPF
jgi:hypothetical protein